MAIRFKYSLYKFLGKRCKLLEKNREYVRHSSGNDEEFTIFDALLESMIKKEQRKSKLHRLLNAIGSTRKLINLNSSSQRKFRVFKNKKKHFKNTLCNNQDFTIYDILSKNIIKQKKS